MLKVNSTKSFVNLPCGHAQHFDLEPDGSPGSCASVHGYDRTVKLTFSGTVDDNGWIVPFGELKQVKTWLEYYFDHVTVLPADDPRLDTIPESMTGPGGILGTLRVLPYGVSMEMSALFIWEHLNPFILSITDSRCYISKVESIEHERNTAFIEVDETTARQQARKYATVRQAEGFLPKKPRWERMKPTQALAGINDDSELVNDFILGVMGMGKS